MRSVLFVFLLLTLSAPCLAEDVSPPAEATAATEPAEQARSD